MDKRDEHGYRKIDPSLIEWTPDDGLRMLVASCLIVGVVLFLLLLGAWVIWLHMEIVWH